MNDNILEVHKLAYSFNNNGRLLFDCVSFDIKDNKATAIVGSNGSGKSTLVKILSGIFFTDNVIKMGGLFLNDKTLVTYKKQVSFIDFSDFKFKLDSVYNEIYLQMDFTRWSSDKKDKMVNKVLNDLNISAYSTKNPNRLSKKNKINLLLAKALVFVPKIIILELDDNCLTSDDKSYIFEVLNKYKDKGSTIIFCTNNSEDLLYSDRMIVLHKGSIVVEGSTKVVLKKDSLLLKLGIEIPFMIDLSSKLRFYEVIDKTYLKEEDLVNRLWK